MADLSELKDLAALVQVLDAAMQGHQAVIATERAFSAHPIDSDRESAAPRGPRALPWLAGASRGHAAARTEVPPRPRHSAADRRRELVVAEVVEW